MIIRVAPKVSGAPPPLLPLSARLTSYLPFARIFPWESCGKNRPTSAAYVRMVLEPCELPEQPPELQDTGALGFPSTTPVIGYPVAGPLANTGLKNPFCPTNVVCELSTVSQQRQAATISAPVGTTVA